MGAGLGDKLCLKLIPVFNSLDFDFLAKVFFESFNEFLWEIKRGRINNAYRTFDEKVLFKRQGQEPFEVTCPEAQGQKKGPKKKLSRTFHQKTRFQKLPSGKQKLFSRRSLQVPACLVIP